MLKLITHNDEKQRHQQQTKEPCHILDEAFCNFLVVPIVAKSSILNVPGVSGSVFDNFGITKTSSVSSENQPFFLLFQNVVTNVKSLFYFLTNDEVFLSRILDVC